MRADVNRKSVDMEHRDISYLLSAYIRLYLFQAKNEEPDVITFPMFKSVPHPYKKGVEVPIEYVPDTSSIALEIAEDGADIPEATPESEEAADKREDEYNDLKAKLKSVEDELARLKEAEAAEAVSEEDEKPEPPEEITETSESDPVVEHKVEPEKPVSPAREALEEQMKKDSSQPQPNTGQPSAERLAKIKEPPGGALPPGTPSDYGGKRDPRDFRRIAQDLAPTKDINEDEEVEIQQITDIKRPEDK